MARYLSNRNSDGYTDENGHFRLPLKMVEGNILEGLEVQAQSSPNMTVKVTAGEAKIPYSDYAYAVWSDAAENLTIATSSTTGNRIDRVVAYVDRSMSFTSSDVNNPNGMKFKVVAGTAASSPSAPSDATVQSSVGAGNPFIELARIYVPMNATSIVSGNIDSSYRESMKLSPKIATPEITTQDGTQLKFAVINEGEALPSAIPDSTLVVLVVKG